MKTITTERDGEMVSLDKPTFDAWIEAWTPGDTLDARELRDKLPYKARRDKSARSMPRLGSRSCSCRSPRRSTM